MAYNASETDTVWVHLPSGSVPVAPGQEYPAEVDVSTLDPAIVRKTKPRSNKDGE